MGQRYGILKRTLLVGAFGGLGLFAAARAADHAAKPLYESAGPIVAVQQPMPQPTQPVQPITPTTTTSTADIPAGLFGRTGGGDTSSLSAAQRTAVETAPASVVSGAEATTRASTDAADLLGKSTSSLGVYTQHRNPITSDSRVRGYHFGQVFAELDGGYWLPARLDLDTMLSKIDSSNIREVIVIKGPYSAMYGPSFSFIDIVTNDTPRYECAEVHGRSYFGYKSNGEQWYGRQSFWGGNDTAGFRIGYGNRGGVDYNSGNGLDVPASYHSQDFDIALGWTLSENSRIEFKGLRLDQTDVEFPGQFFDIDHLIADGYSLRYVLENQGCLNRLVVEAWWNDTRAVGNTVRQPKQQLLQTVFPGLQDFSTTDFEIVSMGYRMAGTWGADDELHVVAGTDFRYVRQQLAEYLLSPGSFFDVPLPKSHAADPGLFAEVVLPINEELTVRGGGRLDWVMNSAHSRFIVSPNPGVVPGIDSSFLSENPVDLNLDQDFVLWSAFVTGEYRMSEYWALTAGLGFAQRPPSLTELYAAQPFIALLQQGLTRITGDPHLEPERLKQVDLGMHADYENLRFGVAGFYAWINDYVTFDTNAVRGVAPNQTVFAVFTNTDLATLAGGEAYVETDLTGWLTPFVTVMYVEGRDRARNNRRFDQFIQVNNFATPGRFNRNDDEPLPGIPPLESRAGFRIHEATQNPRWGVEFSARMVDGQRRVAQSLGEVATPGFTVFDLRSYWQATESLTLTSGVENLFDRNYREHLDVRIANQVYQPGLSIYFGLEYKR